MQTQIVTLEYFAGLWQDMLGTDICPGKHHTLTGVHPTMGQIAFMQLDAMTGDGVLMHLDPESPYIRRRCELTAGERDAALHNVCLQNPMESHESMCIGNRAFLETGDPS